MQVCPRALVSEFGNLHNTVSQFILINTLKDVGSGNRLSGQIATHEFDLFLSDLLLAIIKLELGG